jgi:preprotein translocase subunit YajC
MKSLEVLFWLCILAMVLYYMAIAEKKKRRQNTCDQLLFQRVDMASQ